MKMNEWTVGVRATDPVGFVIKRNGNEYLAGSSWVDTLEAAECYDYRDAVDTIDDILRDEAEKAIGDSDDLAEERLDWEDEHRKEYKAVPVYARELHESKEDNKFETRGDYLYCDGKRVGLFWKVNGKHGDFGLVVDPEYRPAASGLLSMAKEYFSKKLADADWRCGPYVEFENWRPTSVRESVMNESGNEIDLTVDFVIPVSSRGSISKNTAKKLLKHLAAKDLLKAGKTYFIKDSEGGWTCWDFRKSMDPYFAYEFDCEVTADIDGNELDYYNCLYIPKEKGKLDMKNIEYEGHKVD